ncbi:TetR/AcrR family transcriptional regulator [bacterium]|nr:TetR/AcrR family transcriptional regulator [bacterium]
MDKKSRILEAAQGLFSQFGLKKVTTDDIAHDAGISKATIYKHYKNKGEIFLDVVKIETDEMVNMIEDAVRKEDTLEGKLRAYLITKNENIQSLINFYRVTRETWNDHWPFISEVHESFMEKEKEILTAILEFGNKIGETDVQNLPLQAHILVITLKSIEYPWVINSKGVSVNKIVSLVVDTFLNGVRKR